MELENQWYNEMRAYLMQDAYSAEEFFLLSRNDLRMSEFIRKRIIYEGKELVKSNQLIKDKMLAKVKSYINLYDRQS